MTLRNVSLSAALWLTPATLAACDSDAGSTAKGFDDKQVIVDFSDEVVVPTYERLAAQAVALETAVRALTAGPDAAKLEAAKDAWIAARAPWEQSEGFLFGPVDSFGIDPALDTWPLNQTDLDGVLASDDALTPAYIGTLGSSLKGFHTMEYLLFGLDGEQTVATLDRRELEYLAAIAVDFVTLTARLATSWTEGDALLATPYRDLFATAGEAGNTAYPSLSSAAQEIVNGMIGICDEVANGKIADPYDARDPLLEESQFSHNSLVDFQNNLRSVENAYTGKVPDAGTAGRGLSAWVATVDAALDADIKGQVTAAIAAIAAIPGPFSEAIGTPSAYPQIEAAQAAIRALQSTLETRLLPLL